jgi:hypothetical protein
VGAIRLRLIQVQDVHEEVRQLRVRARPDPEVALDVADVVDEDLKAEIEAELAALPAELGESAFARAFAEGRAMTIQQAIVYGLHDQVLRPALRHRRPKRGSRSAGDGQSREK